MNITIMNCLGVATFIAIIIISYYVGRITFKYGKSLNTISENAINWSKRINENVYNANNSRGEKIKLSLSKKGIMYHLNDYELVPTTYVMLKCIIAFVCFFLTCVFLKFNIMVMIISLLLGYFLLDIWFNLLNKSDNKKMKNDVQNLYFMLIIHAEAGVHMVDSVRNFIFETKNARLKEALNEFVNITTTNKASVEEAINLLDCRFSNKDISNLCAVLSQTLETGRSSKMMNDLLVQIENSQKAENYNMEKSHERKMMIILILFAIGVIGMFISGLAMQTNQSIGLF